jgi:hypothetical protein
VSLSFVFQLLRGAGRVRLSRVGLLAAALAITLSCGYSTAYGGAAPRTRLALVPLPSKVPEVHVYHSLLNAMQGELGRAGVLRSGSDYPRLVVEVLRVDELSAGIARRTVSGASAPVARASRIAVVARAWVLRSAAEAPERDTGDMQRAVTVAAQRQGSADALAISAAGEQAARDLGRALVRAVLGEAQPLEAEH